VLGRWVKAHYTRRKLAIQSPFLESKINDFFFKNLNGVEVHIFFPFPCLYHHNLNIFFKPLKIWPRKSQFRYQNGLFKFLNFHFEF